MQRNIQEIGSEFWLEDYHSENRAYVLSGRTAIDLIAQDMEACGQKPRSVYMPAWCCDSMLQPFIDRGVEIGLYDVFYQDGELKYHIDANKDTDVLYVNNYFGYNSTLSLDIIRQFKERGVTILYDRTHALLRDDVDYCETADYIFASIRKWMGVMCGAYLSKRSGDLTLPALSDCPYLDEKTEAMKLKAAYMQGDASVDKQRFLNLYGSFGHHLADDYRNYRIDEQSQSLWLYADKQAMRRWRNANATYLQVNLENMDGITCMFPMTKQACALFVPVLFDSKELRDKVRKHLTSQAIYCPIHWPKPALVEVSMRANELYDRELSLLCDQRYDFDDMQRIIETIKEITNI